MTPEQQKRVVAEAESWIGTPFHHGARIKGVGVDCAQLMIAVYSDAQVIDPFEPEPYSPDWHLHNDGERYLEHVKCYADPVPTDAPWESGDILTYRRGWRSVGHAGIYVGGGEIIHALEPSGKVVRDSTDSRFLRRWFAGAWRLRNGAG